MFSITKKLIISYKTSKIFQKFSVFILKSLPQFSGHSIKAKAGNIVKDLSITLEPAY